MLKVLMLKRSLDAKRAELADLERKEESFQTREAELETAINEVEPGNASRKPPLTPRSRHLRRTSPPTTPPRNPCAVTLHPWRPSWRSWSGMLPSPLPPKKQNPKPLKREV